MNSQAVLQQRAHVRKHEIRRRRADADQIDIGRGDPGILDRAPRRVFGKVGRGLALRRHVTLLDPGSRANPFIAGVNELFEVRVGQYFLR